MFLHIDLLRGHSSHTSSLIYHSFICLLGFKYPKFPSNGQIPAMMSRQEKQQPHHSFPLYTLNCTFSRLNLSNNPISSYIHDIPIIYQPTHTLNILNGPFNNIFRLLILLPFLCFSTLPHRNQKHND